MKDRLISWLWTLLRPSIEALIAAAAAQIAAELQAELRAELERRAAPSSGRRFIGQ